MCKAHKPKATCALCADKSPMENHHLAAAFELLLQPEYNFLKGLSKQQWDKLRKLVIDLVLATE